MTYQESVKKLRWVVPDFPKSYEITPYFETIDSHRWYSNFGPLEQQFRDALCATFFPDLNADQVCTACSGALALEIAIMAHEFPAGARILIPSYTFVATASAVVRAGYIPVFADVSPRTLALDPDGACLLARELGCSAILAVGAAGMGVPVKPWDAFVEEYDIPVILDAAACLGNQRIGRYLTVVFSLHATKPLGIGEGGLVVSRDKNIVQKAKEAANFGLKKGLGVIDGTNAKMSEFHAAVGLAQIKRFPGILQRRMEVMAAYKKAFDGNKHSPEILTPLSQQPVNMVISFQHASVQEVINRLSAEAIESRRLYIPPVHRHPAYRRYTCAEPLRHSEYLANHTLSLPAHFEMTQDDIQRVVDLVCEMEESGNFQKTPAKLRYPPSAPRPSGMPANALSRSGRCVVKAPTGLAP